MAGTDHSQMDMSQPMAGMDHSQMDMSGGQMDLNDVAFDAYLANDRDLSDPEVVQVDRRGTVRLRIINAASSTNFWIDLGTLNATLMAVDGMDVRPVFGRRFEIAMAQRLDIDVRVPDSGGAFPVLAQREGDRARTGVILATQGSEILRLSNEAETIVAPVLLDLERQLSALDPLSDRPVDRQIVADLTGDMMSYVWGINGAVFGDHTPLEARLGERVEIVFRNQTMMSHPMHLHGYHFQVVGLGQTRLRGALRDTVMVPPLESVTIQFDADNPGEWPLHCHNAYHMDAGMMTILRVA
jgi:FtsP/CotA-like multicopper oxidase with cupredoxin domain